MMLRNNRKEQKRHLLRPSPPESPDREYLPQYAMPLDLGSIDFDTGPNDISHAKQSITIEPIDKSVISSDMNSYSRRSQNSRNKLSSRVMAKMKAQRRDRELQLLNQSNTTASTENTSFTASPPNHKQSIEFSPPSSPNMDHTPNKKISTSFIMNTPPKYPHKNSTKPQLTGSHHLNNKSSTGTSFRVVASSEAIETPVLGSYMNKHSSNKSTPSHPLQISKAAAMAQDIDGDLPLQHSNIINPSNQLSNLNTNSNTNATLNSTSSEGKGIIQRGKGKVSRIAKLFTSRVIVPSSDVNSKPSPPNNGKHYSHTSPLSPPRTSPKPKWQDPSSPISSASSAPYTAWPGTQDTNGRTVSMPNDINLNLSHLDKKDLVRNASQDLEDWMKEEDASLEDEYLEDGDFKEDNAADRHLAAVVKQAALPTKVEAVSKPNPAPQSSFYQNKIKKESPKTQLIKQTSLRPKQPPSEPTSDPSLITKKSPLQSTPITAKEKTINIQNLFGAPSTKSKGLPKQNGISSMIDAWEHHSSVVESSSGIPTSPGTSVSKTSSAYFKEEEFETNGISSNTQPLSNSVFRSDLPSHSNLPPGIDVSHSQSRIKSSGKSLPQWRQSSTTSHKPPKPTYAPLSAEALAEQDKLNPRHRHINGRIRGYRGYLHKTSDMPNLMDDATVASSSVAQSTIKVPPPSYLNPSKPNMSNRSVEAHSDVFDGIPSTPERTGRSSQHSPSRTDAESDIFDGISNIDSPHKSLHNVVSIKHGLAAFQASKADVRRRITAKDFDANLTETETEGEGMHERRNRNANIVSRHVLDPTIQSHSGGSDSSSYPSRYDPPIRNSRDLSHYAIHPKSVRKLVRKFRRLCQSSPHNGHRKAFALLEMRSRVMESDIERGLSRRGGTIPVDDSILTSSNRASMCVRDMVIVCKAWRDGAKPKDVLTASSLTQRFDHPYFIRRKIRRSSYSSSESSSSGYSGSTATSQCHVYWEEVRWIDDTDFQRMRCPSMGPSHLHGFDIFTIGDCQSMLLKLTNEQCMQLKQELQDATARQAYAEAVMTEEVNSIDLFAQGNVGMSDSELAYLSAMAEVKEKTLQLTKSENSYELVRNRIELLVMKYQNMLLTMEDDNASVYSVEDDDSEVSDPEKNVLVRRAQKAELQAEVSAREALSAKEQIELIRLEKERELEELQQRLQEMETQSMLEREEFERRLEFERQSAILNASIISNGSQALLQKAPSSVLSEKTKLDAKERVKAKFRSRYAQRVRNDPSIESQPQSQRLHSTTKGRRQASVERHNTNLRSSEEMFQHVEFYERSLEAASQKTDFR